MTNATLYMYLLEEEEESLAQKLNDKTWAPGHTKKYKYAKDMLICGSVYFAIHGHSINKTI